MREAWQDYQDRIASKERQAEVAEYKASQQWPGEYGKEHGGVYPTWGEIAERFPVLGEWIKRRAVTMGRWDTMRKAKTGAK